MELGFEESTGRSPANHLLWSGLSSFVSIRVIRGQTNDEGLPQEDTS